ncbi:unnamed protein product, partial [Vitis vinifera]
MRNFNKKALALLHLKQSFSIDNSSSWDCDSNGITSYPKTESWKKGSDCCSWDGVTCDWVTGHIIGLDLSCSWLFGIIHSNSTLFLLPHLRRLNLAFNDFNYSSVSIGFGRFSSLMHLNLSYSLFSGKIAPEIFHLSNLVSLDLLDLSLNKLTGHIGEFRFDSLEYIDLSMNELHGSIPIWSWNMGKDTLRYLNLSYNIISPVPRSLIICRKLKVLDLGNNVINDTFPHWLGTLPKLQVLVLRSNSFHEIEFVKILDTFTTIDLSSNTFQGEIPKSIGNLNSLRGLNLSHNNLVGHIPPSFKNLKLLESLDLSSNKLIGRIPQELTSLTFLEVLNLSQNNLTGFIPRGNQFETFGNDSYNENLGLSRRK